MEENKEISDVFEEARKDSIKNLINKTSEIKDVESKEKLITIIKERLETGETQWDLLKRMLDGSMTERFLLAMEKMSDREFVRNYLKLLEYSKPKVTRIEGGSGEVNDLTVNIQTMIINEKGEKEFIPINEFETKENEA